MWARYGPTPECEACTTLAAGAQRVTKPHSDECRARMEEFMQRDEDALVQQRLHTDRLRRGSTVVEASEDERRNPDVEMTGSGLPSGSVGEASRGEGARESTRTETEAARSSGETSQPGSGEPMQTAPEDAETRQGLKRSAELPIDDPRSEVRGRGLYLDDDVQIVTPTAQQTGQPAYAAEAHMSMGKMELISNAAVACVKLVYARDARIDESMEGYTRCRVRCVTGVCRRLVMATRRWATSSSRLAALLARKHAGENRRVRLIWPE